MTSANPDPYLRFVETVIDALEQLINAERHPSRAGEWDMAGELFADQLDDTIAAILDFHKKDGQR